jgi:hypothetical protein
MRTCFPAAAVGSRHSLPDLRGSEARWQIRIAETDLDLDDAVPPDARAHGERQAKEGELEMRDLQALCSDGDLPIGGKTRPAQTTAKSLPRLTSGDDEGVEPEPGTCGPLQ